MEKRFGFVRPADSVDLQMNTGGLADEGIAPYGHRQGTIAAGRH
jgi:hypothetical protein